MKDRLYISATSPIKAVLTGLFVTLAVCFGFIPGFVIMYAVCSYTIFPAFEPVIDYFLEHMCLRLVFGAPLIPFLMGLPDGTGYSVKAAFGLYILLFTSEFIFLGAAYLIRYFNSKRSKGKGIDGRGEVDPRI
jgi:hypothetical protein